MNAAWNNLGSAIDLASEDVPVDDFGIGLGLASQLDAIATQLKDLIDKNE